MAETLAGKIGASIVSFPDYLVNTMAETLPDLGIPWDRIPTGIENLAINSRFMERVNALPMSENVPFHSIIGNAKFADTPSGSDSVVAYESSHMDNAVSELIVKSKHNVQQHPIGIQEVRRILMEHF